MIIVDSIFPLKVLLFKKRRKVAFLNLYQNISKDHLGNSVFIDSSREIGIFLLIPSFFWRKMFTNVFLLSTSYPATINSAISIRISRSISSLVQNYFTKSVVTIDGKSYEFYPRIVAYYLILINNSNFNPWYEGTSTLVTHYCTNFPISTEHLAELQNKCQILSTYNDNIEISSVSENKGSVLFAIPQFYEQGYVSLEVAKRMINMMLKHIEDNHDDAVIECSLHPRMNKNNYTFIKYKKHQNNLENILHLFDTYYTINSSTIFSAVKHCEVRVFELPFLDYSFISKMIQSNKVQMIKFNYAI